MLRHADGQHAVAAAVVDNTNGAYSLAFRLELQGEWRLTPHVNGTDIAAAAIKVHSRYSFCHLTNSVTAVHHSVIVYARVCQWKLTWQWKAEWCRTIAK